MMFWGNVEVKKNRALSLNDTPSQSYGTALALCYLSPAQPDRPVLDLPTPEGWKAELT